MQFKDLETGTSFFSLNPNQLTGSRFNFEIDYFGGSFGNARCGLPV